MNQAERTSVSFGLECVKRLQLTERKYEPNQKHYNLSIYGLEKVAHEWFIKRSTIPHCQSHSTPSVSVQMRRENTTTVQMT
jgi:hypothetical protein